MADNAFPVLAVLPDLLGSLRTVPNAVLIAPPGAGKTTMVAPALLDEPYCDGQILLLSPRRLAARMADGLLETIVAASVCAASSGASDSSVTRPHSSACAALTGSAV